MKHATPKKNSHEVSSVLLRLKEGSLILASAGLLFLLLSLLTYHRTDAGWSHTAYSHAILNAGGVIGAWLADFFLYFLGYSGYIFPFLAIYLILLAYQDLKAEKSRHLLWIGSLGLFLLLFSFMALASLYLPQGSHLPYSAGGLLGNILAKSLQHYLNKTGSTLLLFTLLLIGLTLLTGISWLNLVQKSTVYLKENVRIQGQKIRLMVLAYWKKRPKYKEESQEEIVTIATINPVSPSLSLQTIQKTATLSSNSTNQLTLSPRLAEALTNNVVQISPKKTPKSSPKEDNPPSFSVNTGDGLPSVGLLNPKNQSQEPRFTPEYLQAKSREVEQRLAEFSIDVHVVEVHPGPVVTRYEMELAPGMKVSKISNLAKDLARSLSTSSVRVVEVIPGKSLIGIELPNPHREMVLMREVLESTAYQQAHSLLSMVLGKDISGQPVVVDLAKMPHLLVAGTTGSGKSVGLNVMLLSLLFKSTPKEVRMIMIDPKMLELSIYEGIPHLLTPVVTDMKQAANALRWCVGEMERRYQLMAAMGVRNLQGYNDKVGQGELQGQPLSNPLMPIAMDGRPVYLEKLPHIVVLIDEFADMMMVVGKKVEELIARIAQKARAAGIHLILATQRPSVDVITGLIKANIPTRIAFQVSSKIDSRTILDQQGAEQLLGHGDMLYLPPGSGVPVRVHGAFVADEEVHKVVAELKQLGSPNYLSEITEGRLEGASEGGDLFVDAEGEQDPLYDEAVDFVVQSRRVSTSSIQRRFKMGYNRAARIVEDMEKAGVITSADQGGGREVIAQPIMVEE